MGTTVAHSDEAVFEGRIYKIDGLMGHAVFFVVDSISKLNKSHTC